MQSGLFNWWDKAQHVFAFFCLSNLGLLGYQKAVGRLAIGLLLYGGFIEILQWLTGWRSGELADWIANGVGVFIGSALMNRFIQKDQRS